MADRLFQFAIDLSVILMVLVLVVSFSAIISDKQPISCLGGGTPTTRPNGELACTRLPLLEQMKVPAVTTNQ
jgi:hypothetical protein